MSLNGLSGLNAAYVANSNNQNRNTQAVLKPSAEQNHNEDKKLDKTLTGLGIAGAVIALGVGIYCFSRGKAAAPKTPPVNTDTSKMSENAVQMAAQPKAAPNSPPASDPPKPVKLDSVSSNNTGKPAVNEPAKPSPKKKKTDAVNNNNPKPVPQGNTKKPAKENYSVKNLGNGRIEITGYGKQPLELPEYLYHMTSEEAMGKIIASDTLRISTNEQLPALYLFDSENFINHYANTNINGQNKDLLTAIFRQANNGNKNAFGAKNLVLIKIPTADLLKNGKLRVRTQEDFFTFTEKLKDIEAKTGKKFTLRGLCKDSKREELEKLVLSNNIMSKTEFDKFMRDMKIKIHHGYSLSGAISHGFENCNSIEYVHNKNIKLSEFPDITMQTIKINDYMEKNKKQIDVNKARTIFEGVFEPIKTK